MFHEQMAWKIERTTPHRLNRTEPNRQRTGTWVSELPRNSSIIQTWSSRDVSFCLVMVLVSSRFKTYFQSIDLDLDFVLHTFESWSSLGL